MIWQTFLVTGVIFILVVLGMAIGVIVSNRRIKGSCGGLGNMRDERGNTICEGCTNPSPECQGEQLESSQAAQE